jgi:hypothetical protein
MSHYDGGYMEMLKRYLAGANLVRLHSYPVAWHLEKPDSVMVRGNVFTHNGQTYVEVFGLKKSAHVCRPGDFLTLFLAPASPTPDNLLPWENVSNPLEWFTSDTVEPDNLTWYSGYPDSGITVQVTKPVSSDDSGRATVPVFEAIADQTQIYMIFGARATGAFRPVSYPRAVQPSTGAWSYDWQFREVFADEVGGFVEVNPWAP